MDIKGEIVSNSHRVEDFNTQWTLMDRSERQKFKATATLNTAEQMDLTDVYKIFHMKTVKYTFSSSAQETFCEVDHI